MENRYLHISKKSDGKIGVNSSDGVFISHATLESKEAFRAYCEVKANEWLKSKIGYYNAVGMVGMQKRKNNRKQMA